MKEPKRERKLPALSVSTLTNEERETVIRFDKASDVCTIFTADKAMITKFKKSCKLISETGGGATFETRKNLVSVRSPRKTKAKTGDSTRVSKTSSNETA